MLNFLNPKIIYLFGVSINILTINIVKYIGLNEILTIPEIICLRSTLSLIILLKPGIYEFIQTKNSNKINRKIVIYLLTFGLLSSLDTYAWFTSIQTVPVNNAIIILFLSPIVTSIVASIILHEKITKKIKISFLINSIAVFIIYKFSFNKFNIGYILILIDIFLYAFIAILIKKLQIFSSSFLVFIRLLILAPISWIIIHKIPEINIKIITLITLTTLGYLIERILITFAFKTLPVVEVQPLRYFNIVFSIIFSFLILNEHLEIYQIIGVSIIIISSMVLKKLKIK